MQPAEVTVSKERAETAKRRFKEGDLSYFVKFCHHLSVESMDSRAGINSALQSFASSCGISNNDPNDESESIEFQYLSKCIHRDPCHNKVIELPFLSLTTSHCRQCFVLVSNKEKENGNVDLELVYIELSVTQSLQRENFQMTDEMVDGFDLGCTTPDIVLSTVGEVDKQHFFRYEAIQRLSQLGVFGPK